ncbi:MAG: hypothetical protein KKI06_03615 [Euryarchaeota archaeon]|nr:hypothetical protein [Euryarchaeota archaeon]MBU4220479.1 hypothetical protein [Euryarchaeota archaeon]MCG2734786.1 hypothetical protein [Candidatus Methanoperedenaceae archaeon]
MIKPRRKLIGLILIILVSAILWYVLFGDILPEPKTLSEYDKKSYPYIYVSELIKTPKTYLNKNIFFNGNISWIKKDKRATYLIIDAPIPESVRSYHIESVIVYYKGDLPGIEKESAVTIYGVVKGEGTVVDVFGTEQNVPKIYAVQISNVEPVKIPTSSASALTLIAKEKGLRHGETWYIGNGYALNSTLDPFYGEYLVLTLYKNGYLLNYSVLLDDVYTYDNIFSTKIEGIYKEGVVFRDTYIALE